MWLQHKSIVSKIASYLNVYDRCVFLRVSSKIYFWGRNSSMVWPGSIEIFDKDMQRSTVLKYVYEDYTSQLVVNMDWSYYIPEQSYWVNFKGKKIDLLFEQTYVPELAVHPEENFDYDDDRLHFNYIVRMFYTCRIRFYYSQKDEQ